MTLGQALRDLPQVAPTHSPWAQIASQLSAQSRKPGPISRRWNTRRLGLPVALAAALLLAVAAVQMQRRGTPAIAHPVATVSPAGASLTGNGTNAANGTNVTNAIISDATSVNNAQLVALQSHSQALERWLHDTRAAAGPLPGQDLAAVAEIEDMIGLVDVELAAPKHAAQVPLWRRRVTLLEDLTALRYSSYSVAQADGRATAPNRASWIN